MSFIGMITNKRCFEKIKKKMLEESKEENLNFVLINLKSIENIKNIKFETIIVEESLEKFKNNKEILQKIFETTQYFMMNTDKNPEPKEMKNLITYGLNQKADVTISSNSETDILVYWQKTLKNRNGNIIEIEEKRIKKEKGQLLKTYEILIIQTLYKIYQKNNSQNAGKI